MRSGCLSPKLQMLLRVEYFLSKVMLSQYDILNILSDSVQCIWSKMACFFYRKHRTILIFITFKYHFSCSISLISQYFTLGTEIGSRRGVVNKPLTIRALSLIPGSPSLLGETLSLGPVSWVIKHRITLVALGHKTSSVVAVLILAPVQLKYI